MDVAVQCMMGISLAACAGLRAFLPLLVVSLLARSGYVTLSPSFEFLVRDDVILILVLATVLEIVGDKIIAVDHMLDAVGTVVRPAVGAVLASSMLVSMDPAAGMFLGLVAGGSTTFAVHIGKAITRCKTTLLAPAHGGLGNVAVSLAEDVAAILGIFLAIVVPVLAFLIAVAVILVAIWTAVHFVRAGMGLVRCIRRRRPGSSPAPETAAASPTEPPGGG